MAEQPERASPAGWLSILREKWEVVAALFLMIAVLVILDVLSLHDAELALACAPVLFLLLSALVPTPPPVLLAFCGLCVGYAWLREDWRFAALSYPALALGLLQVIRRVRRA